MLEISVPCSGGEMFRNIGIVISNEYKPFKRC